jgi:hypothetical protein
LFRAGDVTDEFVARVQQEIASLPAGALARMADGRVTIHVAARLTMALPALKGHPVPAEYRALGATSWDAIAGAYIWKSRQIGIAEQVEFAGEVFDSEGTEHVIRHEVGTVRPRKVFGVRGLSPGVATGLHPG